MLINSDSFDCIFNILYMIFFSGNYVGSKMEQSQFFLKIFRIYVPTETCIDQLRIFSTSHQLNLFWFYYPQFVAEIAIFRLAVLFKLHSQVVDSGSRLLSKHQYFQVCM